MIKQRNGITLIALVVTIIILLILAGISITMLTGQNGILNRAQEAKEKTEKSNHAEQRKLAQAEALMNTEKTTYKGVSLPEGFAPTKIEGEDSIDDGLVITDGYGNEFVWVEVPKTTAVYPTAGLNIKDFTDEEYIRIETDLHTYTSDYRNGTVNDVYYQDNADGWFENEGEYNQLKRKMLKSVYQNAGFWIGRYEAGIEKNRTSRGDASIIPSSKANLYPYNYVTIIQAKALAEKIESGSNTSSLMFGIQWDLTLKYIETKKKGADTEIKNKLISNSTVIGNYKENLLNITDTLAKYSLDDGINFVPCPYEKKSVEDKVLLTTGANESFSLMNIYDLAGNVWEWTLEKNSNEGNPGTCMGGYYSDNGLKFPANYRNSSGTTGSSSIVGFRVSIY